MNIVFWKYDLFPYCKWAELLRLTERQFIAKGYGDAYPFSRSIMLGVLDEAEAGPIINKLNELENARRDLDDSFRKEAKDTIKQIRLSLCWECGEPLGQHKKECTVPSYGYAEAFVDRELKKMVLQQIRGLSKVAGNAPQANLLLEVALVIWKSGGASPVGPSTENSRWFQAFMNEHQLFPQPM